MAKIVDPSASYMSLPMGIARGNPTPIDKTLVWTNEAEMRAYAANQGETALSYVGQILTLVEAGKTQAFVIKDATGNLEKMPFESEISGSIGPITGDVGALTRKIETLCSTIGTLSATVNDVSVTNRTLSAAVVSVSGSVLTMSGLAKNTDDALMRQINAISGSLNEIVPAIVSLQESVRSISGMYLDRFFTEDETTVYPSIKSYPSNTVTLTNGNGGAVAGDLEVGTKFTPYFTVNFTDGKFTCADVDTNAGCSATTRSVTDILGKTSSAQSGTIYQQFTVGDGTTDTSGNPVGVANYCVSAKTTYSVSNKAKDSKGKETSLVIPAGTTALISSTVVTGFRKMFWGMDTHVKGSDVNSSIIRSLAHYKKPDSGELEVLAASSVSNSKRCIVAIPGTSPLNLKKVTMPSTMEFDITSLFEGPSNIRVEGLNGYPAIDYKVWVYQPDSLDTTESYRIIIG